MSILETQDPRVDFAIKNEIARQNLKIELIASENFVSEAVLEAQGCVMTNKYAEGLPRKRYYGGCENVDIVERLANQRARKLFDADAVNSQPHSGASANMAAYMAFLKPGDTMMGMDLTHGGHLTHGHPLNFSGLYFNVIPYGVNKDTEQINHDEVRQIAKEHKPKLIVIGASAYPRTLYFDKWREICDEVGATMMVDMAHIAGIVAAGMHPNPCPYADVVTTTTHKTLRGPRAGMVLMKKEHKKIIDKAVFPGVQGGPLMHIIAAKAVALREAQDDSFKDYIQQVLMNAQAMVEIFQSEGFLVTSGGTDNHLMLLDLRNKNITGKDAEELLDSVNITSNKNTVPFETQPPMIGSGIRLGTPAMTTRGLKEAEMRKVAGWICRAIHNRDDEAEKELIRNEVRELCLHFPIYGFDGESWGDYIDPSQEESSKGKGKDDD